MPKPARRPLPLSLLFLLIPAALMAFSLLLLLTCNGLSFLCLADVPLLLKDPVPKSSSLLSLTDEPPLPNPPFLQSLNLSADPIIRYPSPAPLRRFSARAAEFFTGNHPNPHNSSCDLRFFMTWISSPESLGPREVLAIESVFKSHPNACLLIVSSSMDSAKGTELLRPFASRGFRVAAITPDFAYLFGSTPAEPWFNRLRRGDVDPGRVPLGQNLSNLLRLVVLYKYGGIYLDADVIVMKSFAGIRNAIGAQAADAATGNWSRLNNAVLVFDKGHPLLYQFIKEFALRFDGNKWGHNGPYLVSRVASRVAGDPRFEFSVLPPPAFYPVDWYKIEGLFEGPRGGRHSRWVAAKHRWIRERSFAVHLWNRQSRRMNVEEGSIIGRIISDCCLFCNSIGSVN